MKTFLRFLVLAGAAVVFFLQLTMNSQAADADSQEGFSSREKPGGHWYTDGQLSPVTHQGKHIVMTINNGIYDQAIQGDFVNDTTIQSTMTRHKRSDGSTTTVQVTLVFFSPTVIKAQWVALDSNSDLHMGQSGITPMIWRPDSKPDGLQSSPVSPFPLSITPVLPISKPYNPMANID